MKTGVKTDIYKVNTLYGHLFKEEGKCLKVEKIENLLKDKTEIELYLERHMIVLSNFIII